MEGLSVGYSAKILADSVSPAGVRLTTFEATFPRLVLAEFNTHRVFSRNSASSRAIPVAKQLRRVLDDPYVPAEFGCNQPGMQASRVLTGEKARLARAEWLSARDSAVRHVLGLISSAEFCGSPSSAEELDDVVARLGDVTQAKAIPAEWLNVHKQLANRLLEPFMWHTLIVTSSEWDNFWNLRTHVDTQPELQTVAVMMRDLWETSTPRSVAQDEWHLPLTGVAGGHPQDVDLAPDQLVKVAVGRCARVSYLTHDGVRNPDADLLLHDRLLESGHLSPFEHPARPMTDAEAKVSEWSGNFRGWVPYRKSLPGEHDPLGTRGASLNDLADKQAAGQRAAGALTDLPEAVGV
jgi:thymidylate synthase ThyX